MAVPVDPVSLAAGMGRCPTPLGVGAMSARAARLRLPSRSEPCRPPIWPGPPLGGPDRDRMGSSIGGGWAWTNVDVESGAIYRDRPTVTVAGTVTVHVRVISGTHSSPMCSDGQQAVTPAH